MTTFARLVDIFKLRIGVLMAVTALAGYAVTPGLSLDSFQVLVLALAVLGASAAAGAFNQYAERDLDAQMERTKSRAFVTGEAHADKTWLAAIALLLVISVALACWLFNLAVGIHTFMGAFTYGVIYTLWLKRRTEWNIVIGGAAGSFAVLAGSAAANPELSMPAILLAVVLFLWTPPHFWALAIVLHDDYQKAGVPMLPVVRGDSAAARVILINTILLVAVSVLPVFYGMSWLYLLAALSGGGYFIYKAVLLVHNANPKTAIRCFIASLVQLTVLLIAAMIDPLLAT